MNRTLNKIIHFQGSKQTWESKIANGEWTNNIVFGLVQDETGLYSKRYYAGRDSRNNDYEVKSSVTVASLASANELKTSGNVGLLIGVVNPITPTENGTYIVEYGQDDNIQLTKVSNEIQMDASTLYPLIDASNRIMPQDEAEIEAIDKSAEGVKVKITDSSDNQTLKFGIDLDKIYLPHGVQRTEAIGLWPASDEIVTEGVGMSVKELLEYYLVKEKFPNVSTYTGSGSFGNFGMTVSNLPKNISTYIKVNNQTVANNELVEIGSTLSIAEISNTLTCSAYGIQETATASQSKITNMNFGYCTRLGDPISGEPGHYTPAGTVSDSSVIIAEQGVATATYTLKDTNLEVNSTLSVKGVSTRSYSGESGYSFASQSVNITEGNNKITLSLTHNAAITRTLENTNISGISSVYPISNKNHVDENIMVGVSTSSITGTTSGSVNTYQSTEYKVIGVYPIFTNGDVTTLTGNLSGKCWYNEQYTEGPVNRLDLVNYLNANQTYLIAFGSSAQHEKALMYVPHEMTFAVPESSETDATMTITTWTDNNTRAQNWINDGSVYINIQGNDVVYDKYYDDTVSAGKCAFKVIINKK